MVRGFDPPDQPWLPGHRGVDLAGETGTPVWAVEQGTVVHAGVIAGVPTVSVQHEGGLRSTYQPVHSTLVRGDQVATGQGLGALGSEGGHCPPDACLHLGALLDGSYVDPLHYLQPPVVRLFPPR